MAAPIPKTCLRLSAHRLLFNRKILNLRTYSRASMRVLNINNTINHHAPQKASLFGSKRYDFATAGNRSYSDKSTPTRINIGTIGHVDHGKTTLTAAITKVLQDIGKAKFMRYEDIDKAPEEQSRGITINVCHVGYSTEKRDYSHTDCPGHIDYIKNMIVGTSQMDGAILVVAATDGTMPQTNEHIMLAKQLGLKDIIVYVNKADLVDEEVLELVELEIRDLLNEVGYDGDNTPVVIGSALCALQDTKPEIGKESIIKLLDCMDNNIEEPKRTRDGPFVMPVEKSVFVPGRGAVMIGTIQQGTVNRTDPAVVLGFGREMKTTVTSIGRFDSTVDKAFAGDNVGLLVKTIKKEAVDRGMFLCHANAGVTQHDAFRAQIYVRMKSEGGRSKPVTTKFINQMYMDTWDMASCILLPDDHKLVMPGETVETDIILRMPMVVREGQKFFIRDGKTTAMSGIVLKTLPPTTHRISGFNIMHAKKNVDIESNAQVVRKKKFEKLAKESSTKSKKR